MNNKKILFYIFLLLHLVTVLPENVLATTQNQYEVEFLTETTTQADNVDWQYRYIDGVLYRRLYNFATNTPLSLRSIAPIA